VLWSAVSELVCGGENAVEELLGGVHAVGLGEELVGCGDHAVFAPFFVFAIHGFGDAVGVGEEDVAGVHGKGILSVFGIGEQADDGAGGFEWNGLTISENIGRIVARVDEGEEPGDWIVFGVEEGGVAVGGGGLVDQFVDVADEAGEVALLERCDAAEAGTKACHEECSGDAFAGDVAEGEGEAAVA